MSTCKVTVELDHERHGALSIACGERVRGAAVVEVDSEVEASALHVELEWFTHGRGNRANDVVAKIELPGRRFLPGAPARVPFELVVPEGGPVSYRGQVLNVDWRVRARVDLPWKIDPRGEEDFVVVAGPRATPFRTVPLAQTSKVTKTALGCLSLFVVPFLAVGIFEIVKAFQQVSIATFLWGLVFSAIPAGVLAAAIARKRAHDAVEHAQVGLLPARVLPGGDVEVRVDLPNKLMGRVRKVSCHFIGEEVVVAGSGTDKHTFRHPLHEQDLVLLASSTGTHLRYSGRLRVPDNAAATFAVASNRVHWHVKVDADITGVPDPSWDEELEVDVMRSLTEG